MDQREEQDQPNSTAVWPLSTQRHNVRRGSNSCCVSFIRLSSSKLVLVLQWIVIVQRRQPAWSWYPGPVVVLPSRTTQQEVIPFSIRSVLSAQTDDDSNRFRLLLPTVAGRCWNYPSRCCCHCTLGTESSDSALHSLKVRSHWRQSFLCCCTVSTPPAALKLLRSTDSFRRILVIVVI